MAILDAAEQLLGRRGYEAMTMAQVAATAGVAKPTIYLRYRSKSELVAAMIDRLRPPLPARSAGSVRDDLAALLDLHCRWIQEHGLRIIAAVLLEQDDHPELMERFQQGVVEPARDACRGVLRAGINRGDLREDADREEIIDAFTGASWARTWAGGAVTNDWGERLIDGVLAGLVPRVDDSSELAVASADRSHRPRRDHR